MAIMLLIIFLTAQEHGFLKDSCTVSATSRLINISDRIYSVKNAPVAMSLDTNFSAQCKTLMFSVASQAVRTVGGAFNSEGTITKLYKHYYNGTTLDEKTAKLGDYFYTGKSSSAKDLMAGDIWITSGHAAEILYGLRKETLNGVTRYVLEKDFSKATHFAVRESAGELGYQKSKVEDIQDGKSYYQYKGNFYELKYSGDRTKTRLADRNMGNIVIGEDGELTLHNVINVFSADYFSQNGVYARFKNVAKPDYMTYGDYSDQLAEAFYNEFNSPFENKIEMKDKWLSASEVRNKLEALESVKAAQKNMFGYDAALARRGEIRSSESTIGAPIHEEVKSGGEFGGAGASRSFEQSKSSLILSTIQRGITLSIIRKY